MQNGISCNSIVFGILLLISTVLFKFIKNKRINGICDDKKTLRSKYFGIVKESNIHFAWSLLFSGLLILMPYIRLRKMSNINYLMVLTYISSIYYPIYNLTKRFSNSKKFFSESTFYKNILEYLGFIIPAFIIWGITIITSDKIRYKYINFYNNLSNKLTLLQNDIINISNLVLFMALAHGFIRGKNLKFETIVFTVGILIINTLLIKNGKINNFFEYFKLSYLIIMIIIFVIQLRLYTITNNNTKLIANCL